MFCPPPNWHCHWALKKIFKRGEKLPKIKTWIKTTLFNFKKLLQKFQNNAKICTLCFVWINSIILNLLCAWSKKFLALLTTVCLMNRICHCPEQSQISKSHLQFSIIWTVRKQPYQTLQSLGNSGSKASLSSQLGDQEQVLWCTHLIGPMCATWEQIKQH